MKNVVFKICILFIFSTLLGCFDYITDLNENFPRNNPFDKKSGANTTSTALNNQSSTTTNKLNTTTSNSVASTSTTTVASFVEPLGILDSSFGTSGILTKKILTSYSGGKVIRAQSDGKILVAGYYEKIIYILRYNADGTVDTSFGTEGTGIIYTDLVNGADYSDTVTDMKIQPDGKIVICGYLNNYNNGDNYDFFIIRYNSNGSLDTTFNGDGLASYNMGAGDFAFALTFQSDGKILVAGKAEEEFLTIRFNTDGYFDTSFASKGYLLTNPIQNAQSEARDVAIDKDGKIVVAGYSILSSDTYFTMVRYNPNGGVDTSFGSNGVQKSPTIGNYYCYSMEIQTDGKILLGGNNSGNQIVLMRYNSNGSLDAGGFSDGGIVYTNTGYSYYITNDITIQPNGKILIAGNAQSYSGGVLVARYNIDGSLDSSFGSGGILKTNYGGKSIEYLNSITTLSDGKILGTGGSYDGTRYNTVIMKVK